MLCCLTKIPKFAPFPVPTMMAVGVASPKAHGQEITRTKLHNLNAKWKSLFPSVSHNIKVIKAIRNHCWYKDPTDLIGKFRNWCFRSPCFFY